MSEKENEEKSKKVTSSKKSVIAEREEKILAFWNEQNIFQKTLDKTADGAPYIFYDGPPFATGLPHYGHLLASTIKDVIPRYQTMLGRRVDRRWGWDCHGLPVENIVEKDLGVSGKKQIEAIGVERFNEYARSKVLGYVHDWKKTIERIGRWVDFDGSYKTMDNTYIESVWWALKEMQGKGLLYESTKVLAYCPRCETPIANSEIAMDGSYRDITDISVYVKFELESNDLKVEGGVHEYILAWTTTPWTLPGNFALAVNPDINYIKAEIVEGGSQNFYWFAEDRLEHVSKFLEKNETAGTDSQKKINILEKVKGTELVGRVYKPLFDYFVDSPLIGPEARAKAWKIYAADFVTTESGTGVVHIAPGYGEDDMNLARKEGIPFAHHVSGEGKFLPIVKDYAGLAVKPKPEKTGDHQSTDIVIIKHLAHAGSLFAKEKIIHSYPHCMRCDTPLFYYAIPSWFVRISDFKDRLLALNEEINWVPAHLKEGRFKKSMEGAPDWTISRNRYWASPLPIWKCDVTGAPSFIGSLSELKEKTCRNKYVVMRHGEAEHNVQYIMSSAKDAPYHLTEKGKESVRLSAKKLATENIDVIIASPLVRTRETADIIAKEIGFKGEIVLDDRMCEEGFGDIDGQSFDKYFDFYKTAGDRLVARIPNGESILDIRKRVGEFLYDIDAKYQGKKILVVTHNAPAKMLHAISEGADQKRMLDIWDKDLFSLEVGQFEAVDFAFIPHNKDFELDFHRPYIDDVTWPSKKGVMRRIPEVIDCWFESGAMPFAAFHYPFEKGNLSDKKSSAFATHFPADFVSEYIAQTRTWFYYMHVVSSILFDNIPFKNVVTTGTVLAEDGQKMSKSKGNFPDPTILIDKYGADPLRLYLLSSPLMKAEDLNFSEKSVDEIYKKIILRLDNVISFYEMYSDDKKTATKDYQTKTSTSENILDKWIVARLSQVIQMMTENLNSYQLDKATRPIADFVDDLSTWYLRRSRDRFKGDDEQDKQLALSTLQVVLTNFSKILAPIMPFVAEDMYKRVADKSAHDGSRVDESLHMESVHLCEWPTIPDQNDADRELLADMAEVRAIVSLGLEARSKANIKVRQPLAELRVRSDEYGIDDKEAFLDLIRDEVNVKEVIMNADLSDAVSQDQKVELDITITDELREEGEVREIIRSIQEARKEKGLSTRDIILLSITTDEAGKKLISKYESMIKKPTLSKTIDVKVGEPFSIGIELV